MRSDVQIADFIYEAIKANAELVTVVTKDGDRETVRVNGDNGGIVSKLGRPEDSGREDMVISVLANEGCGQVQRAYVNVDVYVPDIRTDEGRYVKDATRLDELCRKCEFLFSLYGADWHVVARDCNQTVMDAGAEFADGHTEHIINNRLYIETNNES